MTHFHVSSTNSTVTFSLLSVIFQTADPDNYPRETPDQNHLILSAAQLHHTHTHSHTHWFLFFFLSRTQSLFDSSPVYCTTHQFKCKKLHLQSVCVIYISHIFVMSVCWCTAQLLLQCCCRLIVVRRLLSLLYCNEAANSQSQQRRALCIWLNVGRS